ncbi:hypothetical protein M3Y94_00647200 [Aphelenchoides besseyi]|nr:hypothetical protein M3Y94_00647200 [Aphelenchoides besseyi]
MNSMLSLLILVVVSLTLACAYPCFYCHYDTNAPGDDYEKCKTPYWFTTKNISQFSGATFRKPVDDSQYDDSYPMNTCIYLSSDHVICQCNYSFCNNEQSDHKQQIVTYITFVFVIILIRTVRANCLSRKYDVSGVMGRWGMNCVEQTMPMNYCQRNELGDFWCQCNYDYCNSNPVPNIPGFVGLISMKDPSIRIPMSNFTSGPKFEARRD